MVEVIGVDKMLFPKIAERVETKKYASAGTETERSCVFSGGKHRRRVPVFRSLSGRVVFSERIFQKNR